MFVLETLSPFEKKKPLLQKSETKEGFVRMASITSHSLFILTLSLSSNACVSIPSRKKRGDRWNREKGRVENFNTDESEQVTEEERMVKSV